MNTTERISLQSAMDEYGYTWEGLKALMSTNLLAYHGEPNEATFLRRDLEELARQKTNGVNEINHDFRPLQPGQSYGA